MIAIMRRQWRDRRGAAMGWALGWWVLVAMYVATWPTIRNHAEEYEQILQSLPDALRSAVGSGAGTFSTPGGYLTAELLGITGPLVAVTMGLLLGVWVLARDEDDGTLELVLAQSVTRAHLLVARWLAGCAEVFVVLASTAVLLWALGTTVELGVGLLPCLRAMAMLALLAVEAMSLSLLVGAVTGRAGRSRAIAGAVGLLAFLLALLGPSIDQVSALAAASPFRVLLHSDPFRQTPGVNAPLQLMAPTAVLVGVATWCFRRRDLRLR